MSLTFPEVVQWWAATAGEQNAVVFDDQPLTYAELNDWADAFAAALADIGVEPGDRVCILGENSLEWCVAAIAVMKRGGLLVPLNYRYTPSELASVMRDCAPRVVLADAGQIAKVGAADPAMHVVPLADSAQAARGSGRRPPVVDLNDDDDVTIIYTSGSTADPKGVVHSHRSRLTYAYESSLIDPCWGPAKKALALAPLYAGAGTVTFLQYIGLGMTIYLSARFDGDVAFQTLTREKIDLVSGVPTFFERIAAAPGFTETDLSHIGFASTGGSRVSRALSDTWFAQGVVLRQLYGLTEGGGADTTMDREGALKHPEKCGKGGPFTKLRVVDPDGRACPPGVPGEILIRGPIVMSRYWNNPDATAQVFQNGWLRSGDLGVADEQGNLTLVDRIKDIIISGGLNISPIDVEAVISSYPGVEEVSVFGVDDKAFGETPMAIVFGSPGIVVSEVIEHCNVHLSNYKVPRYLVLADSPLPRLATGKIAKRELKKRYATSVDLLERVR